eukprot:TRINITY_DN10507_c0_g1_i1.p1 TRINITY_DN10507_c0_g1~~TRINITY_DN10507_c0_g1_i1.p1  ORF type:complete len:268 (+),score=51.71 TRINITY_DN10507_c0_g1_i1:426-1229(+)
MLQKIARHLRAQARTRHLQTLQRLLRNNERQTRRFLSPRLALAIYSNSLFVRCCQFDAQQDWMVYDGYGEPIFNYLYHDYITTIAAAMVQGQGDGQPGYMLRRAVIADSLTRGMIMGPFDHDVSLTPTTAWQANLSTLFFNLTRAYVAHSAYVSLGQMVRPPACSNCSVVQTYLYRGEKKVDVNTSGVRLGAFKSNDTIGVVMVNIMNEDTTVLVDLNLYTEPRYLGKPDLNVTIMTLDGVRRQTTATQAKIAVFVPATDGAVLVVE